MTTAATAAKTATPQGNPDDKTPAPRARRGRKGGLEKINAKVVAFNQFARKWETLLADSAAESDNDIIKTSARNAAEKLSQFIALTDATSKILETLKTAGWKAPKPRGKNDRRAGDIVDLKKPRADELAKASVYKREQMQGLRVEKASGRFLTVSAEVGQQVGEKTRTSAGMTGTYPAAWFVRA